MLQKAVEGNLLRNGIRTALTGCEYLLVICQSRKHRAETEAQPVGNITLETGNGPGTKDQRTEKELVIVKQ